MKALGNPEQVVEAENEPGWLETIVFVVLSWGFGISKTWAKIKRAMFPGNQGKGGKRHASRKIIVGAANLRKAGRGQLVVFSCGHHFSLSQHSLRKAPLVSGGWGPSRTPPP